MAKKTTRRKPQQQQQAPAPQSQPEGGPPEGGPPEGGPPETAHTEAAPLSEVPGARTVTIEMPVSTDPPPGHVQETLHMDFHCERAQREALRSLFDGLDAAGARLANGKRVASMPDAVRWVAEQIAANRAVTDNG